MTAPKPAAAASLTMVVTAMMAAIPMITVVMWFVLAGDGIGDFPGGWAPILVVALAVGAYSFCELAGFRAPAVPPGGQPAEVEKQSWQRFTSSTFVRFALSEAVFLVSITIAFVVDSYWIVLVGAVLALPLVAWEAWPGRRNQQRFAAALEAAGHPSYLLGRPQDY
ncbi:hypothetical protein EV138_0380 [Kribbella voronezhensis]|uniref:Uncharacterized protein n=2 Tax=Kribbella voronezhensis TaxID=2512212 RepID=A0A4R7T4U9_9ACTN|nr:hypothetical protein EV138_0380 [Kribbella voronezhensis]